MSTQISESASKLLGTRVTVESNRPSHCGTGVVDRVERVACIVKTEQGEFPGVRFRVKPEDGGRAFWTVAMPDIAT